MAEHREEPQSARGAPGSRDTGANVAAGGPADREPGDIGHEETTSAHSEDAKKETEFTSQAPSGTESAAPPYGERKQTANPPGETATGKVDDARVGGATTPTEKEG
ncbi:MULTISPECIES: hypothetical protein [Nocardia]|uniref:hypothetical protein n=1 Tax=Nocardia abscessus TaxID=120957 RepID=UPI001893FA05|nr:hypothetical protein [Nocardia abscessus]MBF6470623.1 hypothetical protein [Nocardia abscessus]